MAKYCAVCGEKRGMMGFSCFIGLSGNFNPDVVPLINVSDKSEGLFCTKCAIAVGQTRGTGFRRNEQGVPIPLKDSQSPNQIQEGMDYLNQYVNGIKTTVIKTRIISIIEDAKIMLENPIIYQTVSNMRSRDYGIHTVDVKIKQESEIAKIFLDAKVNKIVSAPSADSPEKVTQIENNQSNTQDAAEQIKQFKELLDMGAITQKEFDEKKKQLLNL